LDGGAAASAAFFEQMHVFIEPGSLRSIRLGTR
jgi:hypothetical protein